MKRIKATLQFEFTSTYGQSAPLGEKKAQQESDDDFERRVWRKRLHTTDNGYVFIPPNAIKNALADAAKYASYTIPGKGKQTYTKNFDAGIMVLDPIVLPVKAADVAEEWLFVPSNGRRGGPTRVFRCFGKMENLGTLTCVVYILDPLITKDAFERHLPILENFIGLGRFRPRNGGWYGRLKVLDLQWEEQNI